MPQPQPQTQSPAQPATGDEQKSATSVRTMASIVAGAPATIPPPATVPSANLPNGNVTDAGGSHSGDISVHDDTGTGDASSVSATSSIVTGDASVGSNAISDSVSSLEPSGDEVSATAAALAGVSISNDATVNQSQSVKKKNNKAKNGKRNRGNRNRESSSPMPVATGQPVGLEGSAEHDQLLQSGANPYGGLTFAPQSAGMQGGQIQGQRNSGRGRRGDQQHAAGALGASGSDGHQHGRRYRDLFPAGTYKTEICRSHLNTGYCEYGVNCQFAHGIQELRPRHFDVKYKTQLCKNYHKDGNCRFGSRCKFIHDEHRIQVDTNEFWLVSPSENLVRVEIVENAQRRQQLQALVDSPPPPPPNQSNSVAEEKKRQVLANARMAAARAAAARSFLQSQGIMPPAAPVGVASPSPASQVSHNVGAGPPLPHHGHGAPLNHASGNHPSAFKHHPHQTPHPQHQQQQSAPYYVAAPPMQAYMPNPYYPMNVGIGMQPYMNPYYAPQTMSGPMTANGPDTGSLLSVNQGSSSGSNQGNVNNANAASAMQGQGLTAAYN